MNITAIILAGGKSSRMGLDKGLMTLKNKPMIQHVIDIVSPLVNSTIIVTNNRAYKQFGLPVFEDKIKENGPLAGILTGLHHSQTDKNLVLSCDVPYLNKTLIHLLFQHCNNWDVVIPEKENRIHPLIGVYDKSCIRTFEHDLKMNQRKIKLAIEKLDLKIVDANHINERIFSNLNTIDDVKN